MKPLLKYHRSLFSTRRYTVLVSLAIFLVGLISFSGGAVEKVLASPADFKNTDFVASAPYTYNHATGGGAYDDRTIGDLNDVVEQLEGAQFSCNDIVTFLFVVEMEAATVDAVQTAEFDLRFLADSTGQTGAAIADVLSAKVNYGPVQGGDGSGGTDSGINDDGGSTATLVSETLTGPLFTAGSDLLATVRVTDLEAGETVVVRVDTRIGCKPNTSPTGNLQAQLDAGRVFSSGAALSTGKQTIPFLRIGDIAGTGEPLLQFTKTVTTVSGICGQDDGKSLSADLGDTVKYCYVVTNLGTWDLFDVQINDDNATTATASDDFTVPLPGLQNLDGQGDLGDVAAGQSVSGEFTVTYGSAGNYTNTADASGNNGLSGGNFTVLAETDTANVSLASSPDAEPLTWTNDTVFVSYEDLKNTGWSDWDYNDFVVQIEIRKGLTADNNLGALEINYEAIARGAGYTHRFLHELPVSGGGTATVTVRNAGNQVVSQETSSFGSNTTFTIFERTRTALPPLPGYFDTNTRSSQNQRVDGYKATLAVTLDNPAANAAGALPPLPWDAYIEVLNTGEEVHLVIPGHLDNVQTVNGAYDASNPMLGYDLPLAQVFYDTWKWPLEFAGLWRGYPRYVDYFGSGGTTNQDWNISANSLPDWLWLNQGNAPNSLAQTTAALDKPDVRYFASPVTADLDGDGQTEIVIGNLIANQVEVIDALGISRPGWPKDVGGGVKAAAAVADLDGDGDQEIVIGAADGTLYAWHHTGEEVTGWPVSVSAEFRILATPAIGDLDGDQKPEIVVPLANGQLFAYKANGQLMAGWPVSIGGVIDKFDSQVINSSPTIIDLDQNGQVEIIVGSTDKQLYVFAASGILKWTFPTDDMILSSPVAAEIDADTAGKEIAFGSGDGYFYVLSEDGQLLWKKITGWTLRSSPAAADIDADGDVELLIGGDDDRLWAWHHDGSLVAGWPQSTGADLFSSPAVGDLDGDGDLEIAIGSDDANVYAWHADGTTLKNWPKKTSLSVKGSPALANLDDDAEMEVVVGDLSGSKYIWNYLPPGQAFLPLIGR
ncbi:MAG: LruC domain-containing protein [Chloroflexi bacterium]|jgi:LruC domain-containing protein|nr:LruC domain-containing protein [Chloroflexota bacterium]